MSILKTILTIGALGGAMWLPAFAQEDTLNGEFQDAEGTSFTFSLCGEDGTALCGVLNDIQGASRTEENMAYVNREVVRAEQTQPGKWEGTVIYNGRQAKAVVTQVDPDTIEITGCQVLIFCETLVFNRVS